MTKTLPHGGIGRAGWTLVWSLSAAQLVSWGVLYYAFALFIVPMETALGWSRVQINGAFALGLLTAAAASLPVGMLIDHGRSRLVMLGGSLLASVLLLVWSVSDSLFAFYAIWALMGLCLSATLYEPAFAVLAARLGPSYRKGITALTLVGGLASTVFIPLTHVLIETFGWREALAALAAINLVLCGGIHAAFLGPRFARRHESSPVRAAPGILRRMARVPAFWALLVAFAGYNAMFAALTFHILPLSLERGLAMPVIIAAMALIGPMQVAGRIVVLGLGERASASAVGRVVFPTFIAAILVLEFAPAGAASLFAFAILYGAANGIVTVVRATIVPELLSTDGYATINGAINMPVMAARALAPFAAALIWQATGGYDRVVHVILAGAVMATFAFYLAGILGRKP